MQEQADDIIKSFLEFLSRQRGVYIDAMAGFAGHEVRIERQVARVIRPASTQNGSDDQPQVMMASYEDPSRPDVLHSRIVRTKDYISDNSGLGFNAQQLAYAFVVFIYAHWEHDIRGRLAAAQGVELNTISSDIFGDLREIRHAILHHKNVIKKAAYKKLKVTKNLFIADEPVLITFESMHEIFSLIQQGCATLLLDLMGIPTPPMDMSQMTGFAILKPHR